MKSAAFKASSLPHSCHRGAPSYTSRDPALVPLRSKGTRAKPRDVQIRTLRSKWSEEDACQSATAWLRLATSRAEKFDLVAGQTHELALGVRKASQNIDNNEQRKRWLEVPFIGIGISGHVNPLVEGRVLTAAVVTSVTMELALRMLVRALQTQVQPRERTVVEASSLPDLEKLAAKRSRVY